VPIAACCVSSLHHFTIQEISMRHWLSFLAACSAALLIAACGGSDSTPAASTSVSGSVVKGPVDGATVRFYAVNAAGAKGALLGTTTTGAGGSYNITLADYAGAVLVEATGGTYTDEATGTTKPLSETMSVMLTSGTEGGSISGVVTPLTTIAYSLALNGGSGATVATYGAALNSIAAQFNLSAINLATTVPSVTGTTNSYGQMLRAVSQYVANGGTLATFLSWNSPAALNGAFATAYSTINGGSVTFSFNNNSVTVSTGSGGSSGSSGSSAGSCGVTVSGSGTYTPPGGSSIPFSLPATKICVTGLGSAMCDSSNAQLNSAASAAASTGPGYSLTYNYSYAAGDCAGAIVTVNY
jgi:hypothetical protein